MTPWKEGKGGVTSARTDALGIRGPDKNRKASASGETLAFL